MIPTDVRTFVARKFDAAEQDDALEPLEAATIHDGPAPGARLLRRAVVASGGSIERPRTEIETLRRDYRDVIVEGEYVPRNGELVEIRNLSEPIPDEA